MNRNTFLTTTSLAAFGMLFLDCTSGSRKPTFKKNQTIACLGDSITATKNGYVQMLQDYADNHHPELNLTFLNWGKSSETVTGLTEKNHPGPRPYLFQRLDSLLEGNKVDLVLCCYGINCGIYGEPSPELFDSYKIGIYSLLEKLKLKNIPTVLLTPPPLALEAVPTTKTDSSKPYGYKNPFPKYDEEVLRVFGDIILGIEHAMVLGAIDIQSALRKNQESCYSKDPIHPNKEGHALIKETIVENFTF